MKKIANWDSVRDFSEVSALPVGPQPCQITNVTDVEGKSYLKVDFEIVSGPFKGWYQSMMESKGVWYGTLNRSYKDSALGFFKAFVTAVEKSNPGYVWDWNEKSLVGKYVVVNYREEEDVYNDEIRTRVRPFEFRSIPAWKSGDVKEAPKKSLSDSERKAFEAAHSSEAGTTFETIEDDLPF